MYIIINKIILINVFIKCKKSCPQRLSAYMPACMHIHAHACTQTITHTHTHTHTHTQAHTHTHTGTCKHKHTDYTKRNLHMRKANQTEQLQVLSMPSLSSMSSNSLRLAIINNYSATCSPWRELCPHVLDARQTPDCCWLCDVRAGPWKGCHKSPCHRSARWPTPYPLPHLGETGSECHGGTDTQLYMHESGHGTKNQAHTLCIRYGPRCKQFCVMRYYLKGN